MEGTSFLSGSKLKGSKLVKNVVKHKNKLLQVMLISLLFWLWKPLKKSSVKIFQRASQKFLDSEFLVCTFWHIWDGN